MKFLKKGISSFLIGMMLFSNVALAEDFVKDDEFFNAVKSYILKNYAGEIKEEELYDGAVKGMFEKLDKHSVYMDKKEAQEFREAVTGKIYGIGALIAVRDGKVLIQEILEDSPSKKAGLLPGDIITAIDGTKLENVKEKNNIVDKIKGDKGTSVALTIDRNGKIFDTKLIRAEIKINPVEYKVLQNNIGYLKITDFNENVTKEVRKTVDEFKKSGIKKIVLDLRGNPGGGLQDVAGVSQFFVKGTVVTIKDGKGHEGSYTSKGGPVFDKVAVLINNGSASASEILAGAIQDTKVGILVGEKSYGKGSVQHLTNLRNGEAFKVTQEKYYLPSDRTIDGVGLKPDIEAPRFSNIKVEELQAVNTDKKTYKGDAGLHVLAVQERINILGYKTGDAKGIFGDSTYNAVKKFQGDNKLYPSGEADLTTLKKINEKFAEYMLSDKMDNQLNKAMEVLSK